MKIYKLPERRRTERILLIFDMDGTLYTNETYLRSQTDLLVERLAALKGKDPAELGEEIARFRESRVRENPGKSPSLSLILESFGVSMEENIRWREELYRPEAHLEGDARLRETLLLLSGQYKLALLTNNPLSIARRTLRCLGLEAVFPVLVGLDSCMVSKPHEIPFRKAAEESGAAAEGCVSIGDRYEIDLALPLEMGMGGILVEGVEDVYRLPRALEAGLEA
ncbi:MAG: HAD family hydrolase [Treponema sp.]|jgi:phosphoglycolate phosphatase/putative hydrolase of the HAD superfamily|nr:HAD family hydrolase [Treponema sp.]